jgi:hypothetical protein
MPPAVHRLKSDHAHDLTFYRDSVEHLAYEHCSAPDPILLGADDGFNHLRYEPVHPCLDAVPTV